MLDPKEILDKLQQACDPTSTCQIRRLVNDFNSIHFDTKSEKALEFLGRFDELRKKVASINSNMLTPDYVKLIFEHAIVDTITYQKAELHSFKFTLSELRDMLLEEQLREDQIMRGGSSLSVFRSRVATTRGRGKGRTERGGKNRYIPGKAKSFVTRPVSNLSKHLNLKLFCAYCKRRGHEIKTCFRKNKVCFNCEKSDKHFASDCPFPHKNYEPRQHVSSTSRNIKSRADEPPIRTKASSRINKPKVFRMPAGQAQKLSEKFASCSDSVFAVVGPANSDDEVWVTLGAEEEHHASSINFVCKTSGTGQAFQLSEGDMEPWE
ncbi:hypothetical protein GE061_009479 [Apolygus lucorum]|uniref:CCHC-type domain-containing protein n=1 Tax=Apolygus lucorum TaxID=248454 RepID=A0A8S9Y308_APOLU|nr:hypothetical protein GE061_009479 [Apolygus lucorum]